MTERNGKKVTSTRTTPPDGAPGRTEDRGQGNASLRISEPHQRGLYANLQAATAEVGPTGLIVGCNQQFLNLLGGYTFDEVSALTYEGITPQRWHAMEQEILRTQVDKRGYSDPYEKEYIRKDGSVVPIEVQTYLTRDANGQAIGYWAFIRDITKRKRAEEELLLFKESLENATDAIGFSTPAGRHYYQNKAFWDLFGDIGDDPVANLYVDRKTAEEVFRTIMSGDQWIGEVEMYSKEKEILDIYLRAYATKNHHGDVTGLVGIHTDITERKRAQERYRSTVESSPVGMHFYRLEADKGWCSSARIPRRIRCLASTMPCSSANRSKRPSPR